MTQTMNTGDVARRMGVGVTAEQLASLGFESVGKDKRAVLWDQADYPAMCAAMGKWIAARKDVPMQPKPERKAAPKSNTPPAGDDDDDL